MNLDEKVNEFSPTKNEHVKAQLKKIEMVPLQVKFNSFTLDMTLNFIYKDSVLRTRKALTNLEKIFNNLDMELYKNEPELLNRIWVIRKSLDARLHKGFEADENLAAFCLNEINDSNDERTKIVKNIKPDGINYDESKHLMKVMDDTLYYGYVLYIKDAFNTCFNKVSNGDYMSYKAISNDLYDISSSVINYKRKTASIESQRTFSLEDEKFEEVVSESLKELKDRNKVFITGVQRLNTLLAPGYMSKRLYMYLAFPSKGKSMILLKSALDIKRYNGGIKTKNPDKRPAVLFLNLENGITETVERLYNMSTDDDDIRNHTEKQVINGMRSKGNLCLSKDNNIDIIIKGYKNREINTDDIYTIIQDLSDDGVEVIACIVDYVKRLRPAEPGASEKEELKNITNELKEIAKYYDIPVITAQQLNRAGAGKVDEAIRNGKHDLAKLIGRDSVGSAWEIIENSDWVCIINPETKEDTDELYMSFSLIKRRYRSSEDTEKLRRITYFNQPFRPGNEICLVDDLDRDEALAIDSLSNAHIKFKDARTHPSYAEKESHYEAESEFGTNTSSGSIFEDFDSDKSVNL